MKLELWQLLMITTWAAAIFGVLTTTLMPTGTRIGAGLVLIGLFITFGGSALPRPEPRDHVPNDRQLQRWGDILMLGIPAFLLIWIGTSMFLYRVFSASSIAIGFSVSFAVSVGYCILVFTRDTDRRR